MHIYIYVCISNVHKALCSSPWYRVALWESARFTLAGWQSGRRRPCARWRLLAWRRSSRRERPASGSRDADDGAVRRRFRLGAVRWRHDCDRTAAVAGQSIVPKQPLSTQYMLVDTFTGEPVTDDCFEVRAPGEGAPHPAAERGTSVLVIAALVRCLSANATLFAAGSGASKVRAD